MAEDRQSGGDPEPEAVSDDLQSQLRLLIAENERLRADPDRVHAGSYRRGALGFALLGLVAAGAGYALPESRTVLFSLAGIGLFGAVLIYYLTAQPPEERSTMQTVYTTYSETLTEMAGELGLRDVSIYVPTGASTGDDFAAVRLFVPQQASYEIPDDPDSVFVAGADDSRRGIAVRPTGAALFAEFERSLLDPLAETPEGLADQLAAALVEQFELVSQATPEYDPEHDRITVLVRGSTLEDVDHFDHPVVSFVASGLARGLDRPVRAEVHARDGDDFLVVCSWADSVESSTADATADSETQAEPTER